VLRGRDKGGELKMAEYPWRVLKSLERQISELWKSRGLEVLNESFEPLEDGTFKWTIIARKKEASR